MKNEDVAWRSIDGVRKWQKLKKKTSMLCLNSWVLATATVALKTKKAFTTLFAEGNTTDT